VKKKLVYVGLFCKKRPDDLGSTQISVSPVASRCQLEASGLTLIWVLPKSSGLFLQKSPTYFVMNESSTHPWCLGMCCVCCVCCNCCVLRVRVYFRHCVAVCCSVLQCVAVTFVHMAAWDICGVNTTMMFTCVRVLRVCV